MKNYKAKINPIYTEKTECQDCYKCLRQCPVKAIRIQDGHAQVMPDMCILCGKCVDLCPVGAKKVRKDIDKVEELLKGKQKVHVSLAPSAFSEFKNSGIKNILTALKQVGFASISETAIGAEIVNREIVKHYKNNEWKIGITSACPCIVKYINKYKSEYSENIMSILSPVLAHCKYLKDKYGSEIRIVFIGPCIAKKSEADNNPELLDQALTFEELRELFSRKAINPEYIKPQEVGFEPEMAGDGAYYPVEGGSLKGLGKMIPESKEKMVSCSGIDSTKALLDKLDISEFDEQIILEMLSCNGGCINGPLAKSRNNLSSYCRIIRDAGQRDKNIEYPEKLNIYQRFSGEGITKNKHSRESINSTLREIGKYSEGDELNCSTCGYDTCRDFARALIEGKAEKTMCISYMKQLAQKKTNALMKAIPAGVVIVDDKFKIIDSNKNFAKVCGKDAEMVYDAKPGMEGALLEKVSPFKNEFKKIFEKKKDLIEKDKKIGSAVYHLNIFNIENYRIAGGIIQDITDPAVEKTVIIKKARQVIENNLKTVQEIAYLLGENASETEVILNSIVENFSPENMEEIES
jgi:iron only hydrogenase large subunit-like protein